MLTYLDSTLNSLEPEKRRNIRKSKEDFQKQTFSYIAK
ncbi:hypothetical protein IWQ47_002825 [Aquimarina sp. EL_43]|nr:hypothetical protein [Aquimarina sp. EL_32]MBG6169741.1 hypothetical protein [Aquimarina sp. EL_43]